MGKKKKEDGANSDSESQLSGFRCLPAFVSCSDLLCSSQELCFTSKVQHRRLSEDQQDPEDAEMPGLGLGRRELHLCLPSSLPKLLDSQREMIELRFHPKRKFPAEISPKPGNKEAPVLTCDFPAGNAPILTPCMS